MTVKGGVRVSGFTETGMMGEIHLIDKILSSGYNIFHECPNEGACKDCEILESLNKEES